MKRDLRTVLLVIVMLFAFGCGEKEVVEMKAYGDGQGFFTKEGFVFDGTPIMLLDMMSDQTFIACSIMNCKHTEDSEECEAMLEKGSSVYTIIYNEKMYYFQRMHGYITDVWVNELSGSGRSKVTTIPYQYEKRYFVLVGCKLYFSATELIDSENMEDSKAFLVEFDLNTYECRKLTEPEAYDDYNFAKIEILDGNLYYVYSAYMPDYFKLQQEAVMGDNIFEDLEKAEEHRDYCIYKLDLETLEKTQLFTGEDFERYELYGVSGEYLIFYDTETRSIVKMTPQGEMTTIVTPGDLENWEFTVYTVVAGDYIVCKNTRDNVMMFVSIGTGKEVERPKTGNEPLPLLYNEEYDSILVLGEGSGVAKFHIISMKDYISGDFE